MEIGRRLRSIVFVAAAAAALAGCVVAPPPAGYAYAPAPTYYYPGYSYYAPGYYYPPAVGLNLGFRFGGDRDRHWGWRH